MKKFLLSLLLIASGAFAADATPISLNSPQAPNLFPASPPSGGSAIPQWRNLVAADLTPMVTLPTLSGVNLTALNGSNILSGTVAPARLGSGSAISTKYLRGDSTWQTLSVTQDLLIDASNNVTTSNTSMPGVSGVDNIGIGLNAVTSITTANKNIGIGTNALTAVLDGGFNIAIGFDALLVNTSGDHNFAIGGAALGGNTLGQFNTALGLSAGSTNTTGSYNNFIGYGADVGSNNLSNVTAIGKNAIGSVSNSIILGDSSVNVGIRKASPAVPLDVVGQINSTTNIKAGLAGTATGTLKIDGTTSGTFTQTVNAAAGTWTATWPATAGTSGYVLSTDGSGGLSWAAGASATVDPAVTAGAAATQGAGPLTNDYNVITTAAVDTASVTLPTATIGRKIVIFNFGAHNVYVYPTTGADAGGGTNGPLVLESSTINSRAGPYLEFIAVSSTKWYCSTLYGKPNFANVADYAIQMNVSSDTSTATPLPICVTYGTTYQPINGAGYLTYTPSTGLLSNGFAFGTLTGQYKVVGKTSGSTTFTTADATAQDITVKTAAQTTGAAIASIPDQTGTNRSFVMDTLSQTLTNKTLTTPVLNGTITGTSQATANTASTLVMRDASGNFSAGTVTAALTGNATTATDATNAANVGITSNNTLNATVYIPWVSSTSGNLNEKISSTKLMFNPSTGTITTTTVVADLTGNVTGNTSGTAATITGSIVKANTPFTTKGDLWVTDGTAMNRLAVGTDTYVLTADAASTNGVKWAVGGAGTTTPTASTTVGRDSNANMFANNIIPNYTTTVTSSGTTTLTASSSQLQYFTGTSNHNILLPDVTTLVLGMSYQIVNRVTTPATPLQLKSSGSNLIYSLMPNTSVTATCISLTGTTGASWSLAYDGFDAVNKALELGADFTEYGKAKFYTADDDGTITLTTNQADASNFTVYLPNANTVLAGTTATQTLTNKTLTTPVLNGTITGTSQATANTASTLVMRDASGNFTAGTITATTFSGSGASLTSLNASNLSSGTVPLAQLPDLTFSAQIATYTLVLGDAKEVVTMNVTTTANTLSIPTNASVAFPVGTQIVVVQIGTGQTTISAVTPGTTTVNSRGATPAGPKLTGQYSAATLIKTATDVWLVIGDIQ